MEERPMIKPDLQIIDKVLEVLGWMLIIVVWSYALTNYAHLPQTIPVHFNITGQADKLGSKATILTLPIVSTLLFAIMTVVNFYPHIFNYPTPITQENALRQYTLATRIIRVMKISVVFIFGLIAFKTIEHVNGNTVGLGAYFSLMTTGLMIIPLAFYLLQSLKSK